jgi:RND superfamily putative drug exporter
MADVGGSQRGADESTLRELIEERMRLTQPWYRTLTGWRRVQRWIARSNAALAAVTLDAITLTGDTVVTRLPQRERAVALAAAALAEGTPVVMLDQLDTFAVAEDETAYIRAVSRLAPSTTTIVIGTPVPVRPTSTTTSDGRPLGVVDLSRTEALQ